MKERLKIAIQKKGRLSEKSLELLRSCGIDVSNGTRKLKASSSNFPIDILYLRNDDIPQYVERGVADIGIVGQNEVLEQGKDVQEALRLGFGKCVLSLAIPRESDYAGIDFFEGKRIATSYPKILSQYLVEQGVNADIEVLAGSVEIATSIGLADGICDIVSTGSTLTMNGLYAVEEIIRSEAVLIQKARLSAGKQALLDLLLFRLDTVQASKANKYILLNAPTAQVDAICAVIPGIKSPTVLPLQESGWSSIHSVIAEDTFWTVIDQLRALGAEGILVIPIEKMIL